MNREVSFRHKEIKLICISYKFFIFNYLIISYIEERLLIDKDLISLYINVKQKDAKIVFKKDLNLDKNSLNSLKEELIDLTKLSFEFIFDEEV